MLVLNAREGEPIHIGDKIVVQILKRRGRSGQVRIGIAAPKEVTILRDKVKRRTEDERPR